MVDSPPEQQTQGEVMPKYLTLPQIQPTVGSTVIHRISGRLALCFESKSDLIRIRYFTGQPSINDWSKPDYFFNHSKQHRQTGWVTVSLESRQFSVPYWAECRLLTHTLFINWCGITEPKLNSWDDRDHFEIQVGGKDVLTAIQQIERGGTPVKRLGKFGC